MARNSANWSETRRKFIATTGLAGVGLVAGCVGGDDDTADDTDDGTTTEPDEDTVIEWVMNPAEDTIDIEVQYQPLFEAIEAEFDVEIEGFETANYAATAEALDAAGPDDPMFADTSPGAVPDLGEEIDVVGMREAFGSEQYFGTLVTTAEARDEHGIETVADLEGEEVAMGDIGSVSGGMAPLWILEDAGLDIGNAAQGGRAEDFQFRTASHDVAVEELINDDSIMAAGAGEFVTVPHVPAEQLEEEFPDLAEISPDFADAGTREPELHMLNTSPPIPRAPIVVNAAWESELRDDIEEFMRDAGTELFEHDPFDLRDALNLDLPDEMIEEIDEEGGADIDDYPDADGDDWEVFQDHELWFSGIEAADHETYDPVADFAADLGIDFEDIE